MTTQEAKEWLNRGRNLNREIDALEQAKRRAYDVCVSSTANVSDTGGLSGSKLHYDGKMARYAAMSDNIDKQVDKLTAIKTEILATVVKAPDSTLRTLLVHRYINFKTWEQIAVEMNYAYQHVCRLHGRALNMIKDVILCDIAS